MSLRLSKLQQEVVDNLRAGWRLHSIRMEYGAYPTSPQGFAVRVRNDTLSALVSRKVIEIESTAYPVVRWRLAKPATGEE